MLKPNRVKERLEQGRVCLGTMLRIMNDPQAIALSAAAGWDFVILDTEHCGFDFQTLSQASLVSKYEPLCTMVRVPDKQYHQMARALDLGAGSAAGGHGRASRGNHQSDQVLSHG